MLRHNLYRENQYLRSTLFIDAFHPPWCFLIKYLWNDKIFSLETLQHFSKSCGRAFGKKHIVDIQTTFSKSTEMKIFKDP